MEYPKAIPFIGVILSKKTPAISINQFGYTSLGKNTATMSIGGISQTRESLVSFVKSLNESGIFESVDSPISNFTKEKNIDFLITLAIAQK